MPFELLLLSWLSLYAMRSKDVMLMSMTVVCLFMVGAFCFCALV